MITHLLTYATAFSGCNFYVTQRKSLEIQTCSMTIRKTLSGWNIVKHQKLEKQREYLILEYDYVTWKPRIQKSCFRKQSSVTFSFMRADRPLWFFSLRRCYQQRRLLAISCVSRESVRELSPKFGQLDDHIISQLQAICQLFSLVPPRESFGKFAN